MKTKNAKNFNVAKCDTSRDMCLEALMAFVNGGKYDNFFLKTPKKKDINPKDPLDYKYEFFTAKGAKVYARLTALVQTIGRLTQRESEAEELVEGLDEVANMWE